MRVQHATDAAGRMASSAVPTLSRQDRVPVPQSPENAERRTDRSWTCPAPEAGHIFLRVPPARGLAPCSRGELDLPCHLHGGYVDAMSLRYLTAGFAKQLDLGLRAHAGLRLVHATGRGVQVDVPAGWLSLWLPLAGRLRLDSADCTWDLYPGRLQVWCDGRLRCRSHLPGLWLGLAGPVAAWDGAMQAVGRDGQAALFTQDGTGSGDIRRLLVRMARCVRQDAAHAHPEPLLEALCAALLEQQADLHARLQRCSGRTLQRRRQTLCRLLRVQHLIRNGTDDRLDLARLARSASYSPSHLIRIYRHVFGETPSEYAARLRFERAWRLVRDTAMPVCEITEALGFESQSAFCRAFKQSFGVTATELRRGAAGDAAREAA